MTRFQRLAEMSRSQSDREFKVRVRPRLERLRQPSDGDWLDFRSSARTFVTRRTRSAVVSRIVVSVFIL